jgi:fibronectin-binding autotransporter adhesin
LDLAFTTAGNFANTLTGGGVTTVAAGSAPATITGANSSYAGNWQIAGNAAVAASSASSTTNPGAGTVNISAGGSLAANTNGAFSFNNALTGTGTLSASNSGQAFSFGAGAGSAFGGTATLSNDTFALSGNNTTALANATLVLGAGNVTTVGDGNQAIGNLTFNGGTAIFDATAPSQQTASSLVTTGTLNLSGTGTVQINVANPLVVSTPTLTGDMSLFQQSHVNGGLQLISATSVTGSPSGLVLENQNGSPVSGVETVNVQQNGNLVAIGTYSFMLGTGASNNGLYVGIGLSQLALQAGQSLTLTDDPGATGNNADLAAQLTGTGNLVIAATNQVSLSNPNNTFTGTTLVQSGTLLANAANVIASSSAVDVASTFNTNGLNQSLNNLTGGSAAEIVLSDSNTLTLNGTTTSNTFAGVISGAGNLVQASGTEILTGANTYTGGTTINGGTLQVSADANLGAVSGPLTINGGTLNATASFASARTVTLGASGGTFDVGPGTALTMSGAISGAGTLTKIDAGTLLLTGTNTYSGGTTLRAGTLQLGDGTTNGSITGNVTDNATLVFDPASGSTITNPGVISGTGAVTQIGAGTTVLTGAAPTAAAQR